MALSLSDTYLYNLENSDKYHVRNLYVLYNK